MRAALVMALLVAGCAPQDVITPPAPMQHTTIYRYISAPASCPKPEATNDAALRRMKQNRDEWKRYAEYLETLLPADTSYDPHP